MANGPQRKTRAPALVTATVPPLHNGDHLTQAEFHRRYETMPPEFRAELIGGIVYVSSPLRWNPHGNPTFNLSTVLGNYALETPGVEGADNATAILGDDKEPQPDLALRIHEDHGGASRLDPQGYLVGPPELVIEVAHSTAAIDLHAKKKDYRWAGVREYLVVCVEDGELYWFAFPSGRRLKPDGAGVYRSQVFPGLWLDGGAVLARDGRRLNAALRAGLATPEHAAFAARLQAHQPRKRQ
jgi:Uma2 family endonuclease